MREIVVFSGSAHRGLATSICAELGVELSSVELTRFSNDCLQAQLQANCRQRDVYIVQPLVPPTQEHLMELLLMVDAAKGASADKITAVIPHYAYARSDKKDASRISLGGRLVADLLATKRAGRRGGAEAAAPRGGAYDQRQVAVVHEREEAVLTLSTSGAEALPDAAGFEAAMEVAASVAVAASHAGYAAKLVSSCGRAAGAGTGAPAPTAILDALAELGPSSRPWEEGLASPVLGGRRDVLLTVSGLPSEADLAALGVLGRRYRDVVLVLVGEGASTHPVPAAVANTIVRAVDGEEFALRWNHEVAA